MAGRSPVYAPNGAAATSQPLATTAALAVLQKGGNAVDAAIAAAAVLSVVEPMMTGVGGDMFALMWSAKEKKLVALNASGRAGSLMTREELVKRGRTRIPRGIETVTVPGALAGWDALLKKYGTMTLAQALQPAIGYAENGFVVTPVISGDWAGQRAILAARRGREGDVPSERRAAKGGRLFPKSRLRGDAATDRERRTGDAVRRRARPEARRAHPAARRLPHDRRSEEEPADVGHAHLDDVQGLSRLGAAAEQSGHRHARDAAHSRSVRSQGDGPQLGDVSPPSHRGEEARVRRPHAIRRRRGSSDAFRRAGCSRTSSSPSVGVTSMRRRRRRRSQPGPERTASETIYLTVADKDGNMVSFINSLFDEFGSGIVVPGTGFALHDRGSGFTMDPGLPNTVAPGKRPFHTLIPGFVTKPGPNAAADGTRRRAVHDVRLDGRRDAGAGPCAIPHQHARYSA